MDFKFIILYIICIYYKYWIIIYKVVIYKIIIYMIGINICIYYRYFLMVYELCLIGIFWLSSIMIIVFKIRLFYDSFIKR